MFCVRVMSPCPGPTLVSPLLGSPGSNQETPSYVTIQTRRMLINLALPSPLTRAHCCHSCALKCTFESSVLITQCVQSSCLSCSNSLMGPVTEGHLCVNEVFRSVLLTG